MKTLVGGYILPSPFGEKMPQEPRRSSCVPSSPPLSPPRPLLLPPPPRPSPPISLCVFDPECRKLLPQPRVVHLFAVRSGSLLPSSPWFFSFLHPNLVLPSWKEEVLKPLVRSAYASSTLSSCAYGFNKFSRGPTGGFHL